MQSLCLALHAVAATAYLAPTHSNRRTTRLASLREFRAQDLTLERFLGQVSVTEVTDWEYSGEGVNPLDPAQICAAVTESLKAMELDINWERGVESPTGSRRA